MEHNTDYIFVERTGGGLNPSTNYDQRNGFTLQARLPSIRQSLRSIPGSVAFLCLSITCYKKECGGPSKDSELLLFVVARPKYSPAEDECPILEEKWTRGGGFND